MFKIGATILLISLAGQIVAQNPPTFECIPSGVEGTCIIQNPVTTKSNPNFKISHPTPEKIQQVGVIGGNLAVFTSDICNYFPNLLNLEIGNTGVEVLEENALDNCNLHGWILSGAKVEEIPLKFFDKNRDIRGIYFVDTPIKKIDPAQFHGLQKLTDVGISMTQIEEFPLESITSKQIFWFHAFSNNLKDFPAEEYYNKFPQVAFVGYGDNDISCTRVQEMNDFFKERGIEVFDFNFPKPREEPVEEVGGVICVP